eukprot:TRINITY_DN15998_c0_g2_i1.p1 TRINITY_DN15998_c0_g2~~TRINITY_DN15998_c0_g2_i1.p1  ORF type:complete len:630 (-),score=115.89 TRINITY_DN15998_c0_g2_i1:130-2019(-)
MREYDSGDWGFSLIWGLRASVFPKAVVMAVPNALIAIAIGYYLGPKREKYEDASEKMTELFAYFTSIQFFVLFFRSNVAYSRWWEGGTLLQQVRGEWFNAYSSLIAMSSTKPDDAERVEVYHHQLARFMSVLFCCALQQVSPNADRPFEIFDVGGLDQQSLIFLNSAQDKVEIILQWIQRSTIINMHTGILPTAPPILSRAFQELSRGIVNLQNARKIADFPFPYPYAQASVVMLLIHWAMCPLTASLALSEPLLAGFCSFCIVFFLWCINFIALQLEMPFGDADNDLPMEQFQSDWNKSIGALLHRRAQMPPHFTFDPERDVMLPVVMSDGSRAKDSDGVDYDTGFPLVGLDAGKAECVGTVGRESGRKSMAIRKSFAARKAHSMELPTADAVNIGFDESDLPPSQQRLRGSRKTMGMDSKKKVRVQPYLTWYTYTLASSKIVEYAPASRTPSKGSEATEDDDEPKKPAANGVKISTPTVAMEKQTSGNDSRAPSASTFPTLSRHAGATEQKLAKGRDVCPAEVTAAFHQEKSVVVLTTPGERRLPGSPGLSPSKKLREAAVPAVPNAVPLEGPLDAPVMLEPDRRLSHDSAIEGVRRCANGGGASNGGGGGVHMAWTLGERSGDVQR